MQRLSPCCWALTPHPAVLPINLPPYGGWPLPWISSSTCLSSVILHEAIFSGGHLSYLSLAHLFCVGSLSVWLLSWPHSDSDTPTPDYIQSLNLKAMWPTIQTELYQFYLSWKKKKKKRKIGGWETKRDRETEKKKEAHSKIFKIYWWKSVQCTGGKFDYSFQM